MLPEVHVYATWNEYSPQHWKKRIVLLTYQYVQLAVCVTFPTSTKARESLKEAIENAIARVGPKQGSGIYLAIARQIMLKQFVLNKLPLIMWPQNE